MNSKFSIKTNPRFDSHDGFQFSQFGDRGQNNSNAFAESGVDDPYQIRVLVCFDGRKASFAAPGRWSVDLDQQDSDRNASLSIHFPGKGIMICVNKKPALEYHVSAQRLDSHGSVALCKSAKIPLDTDTAGRTDAFNPAELLLAAIAACMIKGIERVTPMLKFRLRGVDVRLTGRRQDSPPKMTGVEYELWVDTDEPDRRLDLLHHNVRNFGTIFNTVLAACPLEGTIHRGLPPWREAKRGGDTAEAGT